MHKNIIINKYLYYIFKESHRVITNEIVSYQKCNKQKKV